MGMNRTAKPFSSMTYLLKDKRKERLHTSPPVTNEFSEEEDDFYGLIERLKKLNRRLFHKDGNNNIQDPEIDQSRQKLEKRKIILQKIGQLETDINDMMAEDLQNHTRSSTSLELEQEIHSHENFAHQTQSLSNV